MGRKASTDPCGFAPSGLGIIHLSSELPRSHDAAPTHAAGWHNRIAMAV